MTVTAVRLGGRPDLPLLILGPSLGTSVTALWSAAAAHLADTFQVVGWDLPGHGHDHTPLGDDPISIARLARPNHEDRLAHASATPTANAPATAGASDRQ